MRIDKELKRKRFSIIFIEFFGSPFMKNASIICGLVIGMIVAGACGYVSGATITSAPPITFLWVKTFPLKLYGPAILPFIMVYIALGCEVRRFTPSTRDG
jgi:xanthine/uracil permease